MYNTLLVIVASWAIYMYIPGIFYFIFFLLLRLSSFVYSPPPPSLPPSFLSLPPSLSLPQVLGNLGAADIDSRLEEQLIDGILYAFQEQTNEVTNITRVFAAKLLPNCYTTLTCTYISSIAYENTPYIAPLYNSLTSYLVNDMYML